MVPVTCLLNFNMDFLALRQNAQRGGTAEGLNLLLSHVGTSAEARISVAMSFIQRLQQEKRPKRAPKRLPLWANRSYRLA